MNELEAMKERQATRRKYHPGPSFGFPAHDQAEADLDRAIQIAEEVLNSEGFGRAVEKKAMSYHESACVYQRERDQARQDVLKLRRVMENDHLHGNDYPSRDGCERCAVLEATAHYEQHRQTQEGE